MNRTKPTREIRPNRASLCAPLDQCTHIWAECIHYHLLYQVIDACNKKLFSEFSHNTCFNITDPNDRHLKKKKKKRRRPKKTLHPKINQFLLEEEKTYVWTINTKIHTCTSDVPLRCQMTFTSFGHHFTCQSCLIIFHRTLTIKSA